MKDPETELGDALFAYAKTMLDAEFIRAIMVGSGDFDPNEVEEVEAPALGIARQPRNAAWTDRSSRR